MKRLIKSKYFDRICCALLCAVMIVTIVLPAAGRVSAQPEAPEVQAQSEITLLGGGEAAAEFESGESASEARADAGKAGGTTGTDGGDRPDTENPETASAASSADEKDNNIEKSEQDGKQEPENNGSQAAEPDYATAEIGTTTGPEEPDDTTEADDSGSDGEEESALDLAAVLTWYKYGNEENTIVCAPDGNAGKRILTSQLRNGRFRYEIGLAGPEAASASIERITLVTGADEQSASQSGSFDMQTALDGSAQRYIFYVEASVQRTAEDGEKKTLDTVFVFVLSCEDGLDLSLNASWTQNGGGVSLSVAADGSASREVRSSELQNGELHYSFELTGLSASGARIAEASYTSAHAGSGQLDTSGGVLTLTVPEGQDSERYMLTVWAEVDEGGTKRTVTFTIYLQYHSDDDLSLELTWYRGGLTAEKITCAKGASAAAKIKQNQLINGAFQYYLTLTGDSAPGARLTAVNLTGPSGTSSMEETGSVDLRIPAGQSAAVYTLQATAKLESGKTATFKITITYTGDVSAQLRYSVKIDGQWTQKTISCENGRTVNPDVIFNDQLENNQLENFEFSITGEDGGSVRLEKLSLYQRGTGRDRTIASGIGASSYTGTEELYPGSDAYEGINQFELTASDEDGGSYRFVFLLRYQTRGDKKVEIQVNLEDGQEIPNETEVLLRVTARSLNDDGSVFQNIRADGLTVMFDKEEIKNPTGNYTQEYTLYPKNPDEGDSNVHTLVIHAYDGYGNEGDLTLTLNGKRVNKGKETGATVSISVDLRVLGMGIIGPMQYNVLYDEPVSYIIAKTLWGEDIDDTFGDATFESLGFDRAYCSYSGQLDSGFYLQSLGGSILGQPIYYTSSGAYDKQAILSEIDNQFGKGTPMATLWRCIVRNDISLNPPGGMSIGEFDFTQGSGWLYAIDGGEYPGHGMDKHNFNDFAKGSHHTLTLRYTLAYGWDVGSGVSDRGNSVGYCVELTSSGLTVNHHWAAEKTADGLYVCENCGLEQECEHEHTEMRHGEDGKCGKYCLDCGKYPEGAQEVEWISGGAVDEDQHKKICNVCGKEELENHEWSEEKKPGSCKDGTPDILRRTCTFCGMETDEEGEVPAHSFSDLTANENGHYRICHVCQKPESGTEEDPVVEPHSYVRNDRGWKCSVCQYTHSIVCGGTLTLAEHDCKHRTYTCDHCSMHFEETGEFDDDHSYVDGICIVCGKQQDGYPVDPDPGNPDPDPGNPDPDPDPNPDPDPGNPDPDPDPGPDPGDPDPDPGDPGGSGDAGSTENDT